MNDYTEKELIVQLFRIANSLEKLVALEGPLADIDTQLFRIMDIMNESR
jgi:hypothetical protein